MQIDRYIPITCQSKQVKFAHFSRQHKTDFHDTDRGDGYFCKLQLTGGPEGITLIANFLSDIYSFPLYSETWFYGDEDEARAAKTFNRCANVVEDMKIDYEQGSLIAPNLQAVAREQLRHIDVDRKKLAPSRSLEAAKFQDGETDWRKTIYGPRYPVKQMPVTAEGDKGVIPTMAHNITTHVKAKPEPYTASSSIIPVSSNRIAAPMSPMQEIAERDMQSSQKKGMIKMNKDRILFEKQQEEDSKATKGSNFIPMSANRILT